MSHFHHACAGKRRHDTYDEARRAAVGTGKAHNDHALVPYRCEHCRGFHVGHGDWSELRRRQFDRLIDLIDRANNESQPVGGAA